MAVPGDEVGRRLGESGGEMEKGSRATIWWSWEERRWSELGSPRRGADDGGTGRRRCFSGDAGRAKSD